VRTLSIIISIIFFVAGLYILDLIYGIAWGIQNMISKAFSVIGHVFQTAFSLTDMKTLGITVLGISSVIFILSVVILYIDAIRREESSGEEL
jgi:hypothetical protein